MVILLSPSFSSCEVTTTSANGQSLKTQRCLHATTIQLAKFSYKFRSKIGTQQGYHICAKCSYVAMNYPCYKSQLIRNFIRELVCSFRKKNVASTERLSCKMRVANTSAIHFIRKKTPEPYSRIPNPDPYPRIQNICESGSATLLKLSFPANFALKILNKVTCCHMFFSSNELPMFHELTN
jgi:hypothetical protein